MPWIRKNGKEEFVWPKAPEPSPPFVDLDTLKGRPDAWQKEIRRQEDFTRLNLKRGLVDLLKFYTICKSTACKRAKACKSPTVACYWPEPGFLKYYLGEDIMVKFRARAREMGFLDDD